MVYPHSAKPQGHTREVKKMFLPWRHKVPMERNGSTVKLGQISVAAFCPWRELGYDEDVKNQPAGTQLDGRIHCFLEPTNECECAAQWEA